MLSTQDPKAWTWTRHIACARGPHSLVVERDKAKHKHRKMHQSGSGDQLIINVKSRQGPGPRIIRLFHVQKAIWEINYSWKKKKKISVHTLGPKTLCLGHSEIFTGREVEGQKKIRFVLREIPLVAKWRKHLRGEVQARAHWGLS